MSSSWPVDGVPELDRVIVAGGGEATAVGAERNARDGAGVSLERERSWPVAASQILTVLSSLAEAMRRPLGLNERRRRWCVL